MTSEDRARTPTDRSAIVGGAPSAGYAPAGARVARFVVVEGLIGVGKTSLCRLLRDVWGAELILEPSETNPFLEPFYEDPERFAFPAQMFYLVNRWRQQDRIRQPGLFERVVVSDYLFAKDRMFAEKTLNAVELDLYDRFAGALGEQVPTPDLLVYLHAPTSTLLERIARRRAPGETHIAAEYLDDLRARYDTLLSAWTACPLLRIDNSEMNYVDTESGRQAVLDRIEAALDGRTVLPAPGSMSDREAQGDLFPPAPGGS